MAFTILHTADADLNRVQQAVKAEFDLLQAALPASRKPSTPITADYSVRLTDVLVLARAATDINVTLPDLRTCVGREFTVKNLSADSIVNVRGFYVNLAFQTIDSVSPYRIPTGTSLTVYSDGANWWVK